MLVNGDSSLSFDVSTVTEMTHETMMSRWHQGLVTPMSSTISTIAKTDGSWWTSAQAVWHRVLVIEDNQRLDCHHDRFSQNELRTGSAARTPSAWDKRPQR